MKKNLIVILAALVVSIGLGFALKNVSAAQEVKTMFEMTDASMALFPQKVISTGKTPHEVTKLYRGKDLVGIVSDESRLDALVEEVYEKEYQDDYPGSKLGFKDDLYQTNELTYNVYENKDAEIFDYIHKENLFAIETNRIEFKNGAVIYVKNMEDFKKAQESFVKNFISDSAYDALKNNKAIPALVDYGTREVGLEVKEGNEIESLKISKGLASKEKIYQSEADILTFLSYGFEPELKTYVVEKYENLDGVGWKHGMTAQQIASINRDKIKSVDQAIYEGLELNVSEFNSPFNVEVVKETLTSEVVYPDQTIYQEDPTLTEGKEVVEVVEQNGSKDVVYQETFVNGKAVASKDVSSKVIIEPVRGVVRYGTKVEPKVGSGKFRWPINGGAVLCGYGCYSGHQGVDFHYPGGGYGPIYSVDRGVVVTNSYNPGGWGNYIVIDHQNGYRSLYAHMMTPGYFQPGQTVAKGDNIGTIGMTGRTTAPHIHLEIYSGGSKINPCTVVGC
ncbi:peptidoglycan DD-metalloendopeptidase family protein [Erysipelothrix inopinata]|uniref:Peptidoglycan DD-metalloendopeptidase family protein n=1 Tax=Erysipelothrix inopinata TaxID=225084 RepID=A0A7G9S0Q9_9FIRM|nr:M23 family metallopeptidase [Erysipelothrix inopinata]QNN61434.1 peptidoglycan DD-metalloendopeptidase family protein [Erysipelothrix inopinata]